MPYSKILGTGSYLPEKVLTNAELETMMETSDEWIMKRVGIRERHLVGDSGDTTASMATEASKRAIEAANISTNDIDMIIVATGSGNYLFPSVACLVQDALNIRSEIPAFDINSACSGFVFGMSVADQFIKNGAVKTILLVGIDTVSSVLDWTDRATCVLFGDGGGAVILQASETPGILATEIHSAGQFTDKLYAKSPLWSDDYFLKMDGQEVFKFAVTKLDEIIDQTLTKAGLTKSDIDWLIPHQANKRIIEATAKRCGLSMDQVVVTVEEHGNTSAGSIPLALDQAVRSGNIKRGEILMIEAFGGGLSWGGAVVKY